MTTMAFIGVTTGRSSIRRIFPHWADRLGLPNVDLVGIDLPPESDRHRYRSTIKHIRDDEACRGALVTTHKIAIFNFAGDLFDEIDGCARAAGEISSISKRNGRLVGKAKDPYTSGAAIEEFLPNNHFRRTRGEVVILGSGGAATAIATYLLARRADQPRVIASGLNKDEGNRLRQSVWCGGGDTNRLSTSVTASSRDADQLVGCLPAHSLVVNATGMGKDQPGSPVSDTVKWPQGGYVWDLNYRGELDFMYQAKREAGNSGLHVIDGWRYFIHGWSQVIAEVFDLEIDSDRIQELDTTARNRR